MKKNKWWVIIITIVLIIAIIFGVKSFLSDREKTKLANENQELQASLDAQKKATDVYIAKLDTCENNIQKPLTTEERLAKAEAELARLKSQPVAVSAPVKIVRRVAKTVKRDIPETKFQSVPFAAPVKSVAPTKTETNYTADNSSLPITNYTGAITGDFGTTIDDNGHLLYLVKASVIANNKGNIAPRLNGENGAPFILDKTLGYWYYVDARMISVSEINNPNYVITWNVYIGQVNYGTGSYPAYLPHESLKSLITKVRGKDSGEITKEDLAQMQENASIANGTIHPLQLSNHPGHDNPNFWHGWNFVTKIFAKKKTVIQ